jgi:hypothetical protein
MLCSVSGTWYQQVAISAGKKFLNDVCSLSECREVERHGSESETRLGRRTSEPSRQVIERKA